MTDLGKVRREARISRIVLARLRRTYENGHINWNKSKPWPEYVKERIRQGCLNSEIGMGQKIEEIIV